MPRPPCGMPILKASTYVKGRHVATIERIAEQRGWSISKTICWLISEALTLSHCNLPPGASLKPKQARGVGPLLPTPSPEDCNDRGRSRGGMRRALPGKTKVHAPAPKRKAPRGSAAKRVPCPPAGASTDASSSPPAISNGDNP